MGRWFALPLAALLVAAAVVRLTSAPRPVATAPVTALVEIPHDPEPPAPPPQEAPLPEPAPAPRYVAPEHLTADELKTLAEARFADETILAYARSTGRPFRPSADDLVALRRAGMTDILIGRLMGAPEPVVEPAQVVVAPAPPPVPPATVVYSPVSVTVIEAPPPAPEPAIQTVVLCAPHPAYPVLQRPAIYQEPPFFKTHEFMPTKRLPTAEEVARREEAKRRR